MMFNFPTQSRAVLEQDLAQILDLALDQVTYYPLMVSATTGRQVAATLGKVTYHLEGDYYRLIGDTLVPPYHHSSAWCFSRKDTMIDEYIVDYDEYAGVGSGAIGYLEGMCYANTFNIQEYIARLERDEPPLMASRSFSRGDKIRYDFLMHLFGTSLDPTVLREKYGASWWYPLILPFSCLYLTGRLTTRDGKWCLTPKGYYAWIIMMREFLPP